MQSNSHRIICSQDPVAGTQNSTTNKDTGNYDLEILERIQDRVLWLSMQMIHYANSVRENPDGGKVGGHQASSSSVVSLMTALYFHALRREDRVSIKPHASPVYHAIQFLLGNLPAEKLKEFRSFRGLQAYPSRTKDVDGVDISTGSVGLGAVAPNFAALAQEFVHDHIGSSATDRFIALVGDAELDEGNVWEALGEENLQALGAGPLDYRSQSPELGPGNPEWQSPKDRGDVPRQRLACPGAKIRSTSGGGICPLGRADVAPSDRPDEQ